MIFKWNDIISQRKLRHIQKDILQCAANNRCQLKRLSRQEFL